MSNPYDLFVNPTPAFRGKPFWAWNGQLEREELLRQIHIFKEMGYGGFFMHSRTGLATEYLGEEWFELIRLCAEEAERLGMEAWLYDEDRWPSGTAGGLVTTEPRFRLKFISLHVEAAETFQWRDSLIAAFSCQLEGLSYYNCRQLAVGELPAVESGYVVLTFSIAEMEQESFYNGHTYVDTLNREATDKFLELTHERYKQTCGELFGNAIKGIFTDEPHRGALMDGFGITNANPEWHAPWTYTLFQQFQETFGYDLIPHLPELFLWPEGKKISQVKWHYVELLQVMFLDNFAKPINEWCRSHNLILTGHVLHEDNLTSQAAMCGSVMRYYEHMEYPGVDVLSESNSSHWIVKQLSSAARQLGKTWLLSELYGCTGWQMPLEAHKAVGNWQALFGINLRCPHLAWYTMEGQAKRDYPASLSHHSAWWRDYSYVETYFSRLGVVMTTGKPICDILVLNPIESLWCQVYPGWSKGLLVQSPEVQQLEEVYKETFQWLAGAQIDFDYGDEEMMGRMARVAADESNGTILQLGQSVYRAVVVAGMTTMRLSTLKLLHSFREAGGKVIFAGAPPAYIDAIEDGACLELSADCISIPLAKEPLISACREAAQHRISVVDANTGMPIEDIYGQMRRDDSTIYVVLMNMNRERRYPNVRVGVQAQGSVEEWDCASGERRSVNVDRSGGFIEIEACFEPSGEHVYAIRLEKTEGLRLVGKYEDHILGEINGPFAYTLEESNVCVLDQASYRIEGGDWNTESEILKVDRAVRDTLQLPYRGGAMIQPWYKRKYEKDATAARCRLELKFSFFVEELGANGIYLVMERPERFRVLLNNHELAIPKHPDWWIDFSLKKVEIPLDMLKAGDNDITLVTDFHADLDLEAIYLVGMFGVYLNGNRKRLGRLPEKLEVGCLTGQGLPFYSGALTYQIEKNVFDSITVAKEDVASVMLSFPSFAGACVKIKSAINKSPRMIAWRPYEADVTSEWREGETTQVEVVLTRRNTFGPLHEIPLYTIEYGPYSFVTEGDHFSNNYELIPSGLLEAPQIVRRKLVEP
ncbi:hypothetical protein B1748_25375 [Paenibacillus sp. MY03]|uniref:glycosyl hydrolase n=1 Tax=Paenibacillus sp. MY03 TaxID=302980 RepID=UPI000B3BDF4A|nr:glycosyl hydrolase [Paenibacillus sp. MY03]OUS72188.1 hypothetical protein B1748_25375 [Paenibacillus sp. MY03]